MSKVGFNDFASHVKVVKTQDSTVARNALRDAGFTPKTRMLMRPVSTSPLLLVRYRRAEFHSVSPAGAAVSWKHPHLVNIAGSIPQALSEMDLDRVAHHLQIDVENVYVLGQLNVREEDWQHIRRKLHTLGSMRDLVKWMFKYKSINPKLAEMLHFHALDVLALSNGTIRRIPPNATDSYARINSFGFKQLWLGDSIPACNAKELSDDVAVSAAVGLFRKNDTNAAFDVTGAYLTPLFNPKQCAFTAVFPVAGE